MSSTGLPQLTIDGLAKADACTLLDSVLTIKVDQRIRDQIVAETRGNPLALVELPRELAVPELAGGFGLPGAVVVPGGAEEMFRRRVEALPAESRRLLLLAAAEPTGDPVLLWRAAALLGIGSPAARSRRWWRGWRGSARGWLPSPAHPLAVYQSHRPRNDRRYTPPSPTRRTPRWIPTAGPDTGRKLPKDPDEDVAGELERSASRAQARGGVAAAAAFLSGRPC